MMEKYCDNRGTVIPGEDIVQPKIPVFSQEKNIGKFIESKLQESKICVYPNWDSLYSEPGRNLMRIRRELYNTENKLNNKRQEYLKVRVDLDTEWKTLQEKEEALKKNFIHFHKFVKENEEKRERSKRQIIEEEKVQKQNEDEIEVIKQKVQQMSNVRASLEDSVKNLRMFEDYLADVITKTSKYKTIENILIRFDSLSNARSELTRKQKESLECLEKQRIEMVSIGNNLATSLMLTEERTAFLMGLNNQLEVLQRRYKETLNLARYWKTIFYKTKNECKTELLKIEIVKSSLRNIYEQMCKKKGVPVEIDIDNVEDMLHYIKVAIKEYEKIAELALKTVAINNSIVLTSEM